MSADADLTTISAKAVRKGIQAKVEFDITPHKQAINELIGGRFDVAEAKQTLKRNGAEKPLPSVETPEVSTPTEEPTPSTNGVHKSSEESAAASPSASSTPVKREADDDDLSDVVDNAPPKKKRKAGDEDDAAIAARLQAEEDRRSRSTRGGATRKSATTKKKTPKKKSKNKIGSDEDSDLDGEEKAKKKVTSNTGFHKPLNLSPQLSALLDGHPTQMSRPQVTSHLWKHIKGNNLQDPADKRHILCDDPMKEVFKLDRVHMFQMTKIVNQHMWNPEE